MQQDVKNKIGEMQPLSARNPYHHTKELNFTFKCEQPPVAKGYLPDSTDAAPQNSDLSQWQHLLSDTSFQKADNSDSSPNVPGPSLETFPTHISQHF